MFRPLGTVIPGSVLADIGGFMNNDQIQEFSLLSPRTNSIFKKNRLLQYDRVRIEVDESELMVSYSVRAGREVNYHEREIDLDKEDPVGKLSLLLSTSRKIDEFSWYGCAETKTVWNISEIDEHLLKLMFNIKFKKMIIGSCTINVCLPLFMKFLYRHGKILDTNDVGLPIEHINNKTLRLIAKVGIKCINGIDLVVDVNDELLKETSSALLLSNCSTQITIKGIRTFVEKEKKFKFGNHHFSFGTLGSDQLMEAIAFKEEYVDAGLIDLWSENGHKTQSFTLVLILVNGNRNFHSFNISLDKREDPLGMVSIPEHFVGPMTQECFLHFEKICHNPDVQFPINQYHMEFLEMSWVDNVFSVHFIIENEQPHRNNCCIRHNNLDIGAVHKCIFGVLSNCISIDCLGWCVSLTDDLYEMLKPISATINIRKTWVLRKPEIHLSSANLQELRNTKDGLFGTIKHLL